MKRNIIDELKKCKEEGTIIEIYSICDDNDSNFIVGIILDINDKYFTYAAICTTGEFNGIRLDMTANVYRICKKSRYISKLCEIIRLYDKETFPEKFLCLSEADPITFLKKSKEIGMPVSISLNVTDRYSITGFIKYVDKDVFEIETIDIDAAIFNGTEIISMESISYICGAGIDEQILFDLNESGFII